MAKHKKQNFVIRTKFAWNENNKQARRFYNLNFQAITNLEEPELLQGGFLLAGLLVHHVLKRSDPHLQGIRHKTHAKKSLRYR
jgi:hypothetical protein